jgi:precorrin-6Y C5,15-methyltransferase (decarboxylating)
VSAPRTRTRGGSVTVVGIGADGWAGLTEAARALVLGADVILGGERALGYLADDLNRAAERVALPAPLLPALPDLLATYAGRDLCLLASGDPMFYGIGATLVRLLGPDGVHVLPHPSSASLACARLGWAAADVDVVSAVGRPLERLHALVAPGRRLLVLSAGAQTPAAVARLLTDAGYGPSRLTVLEQLGGPAERLRGGVAAEWQDPADGHDALNLVAVECLAGSGARLLACTPGLPDDVYDHDGQLTKREVRAVTLARLVPLPGQVLWDVGGGAGSVAIEWMRAHRDSRAVAIEARPDRAERIAANAAALGVPGLRVVTGEAPAALAGLPAPDAVFVGGGATVPGLIEACWVALRPRGRLVVNAVTLETEALVVARQAELGGELTRIEISRAAAVGSFTTWRPMLPVTQWAVTR